MLTRREMLLTGETGLPPGTHSVNLVGRCMDEPNTRSVCAPRVILWLLLLGLPFGAFAHGGRLDASGCHHVRKTGEYHCHGNVGSSPSASVSDRKTKGTSTPASSSLANIVGTASVIDGDTLDIHGTRIRLHGVDTPESSQLCLRQGSAWRCGQEAALRLSERIGRSTVSCKSRDTDRYGRVVAVCISDGIDLNRWLVAEGLALAYRQYSHDYVDSEASAKAAVRGVWASEFEPPWEWRQARKKK